MVYSKPILLRYIVCVFAMKKNIKNKYNVFGEEIEEEPRYIEYNYAPDAELNFTTPSGDKMVAFCYEIYYD